MYPSPAGGASGPISDSYYVDQLQDVVDRIKPPSANDYEVAAGVASKPHWWQFGAPSKEQQIASANAKKDEVHLDFEEAKVDLQELATRLYEGTIKDPDLKQRITNLGDRVMGLMRQDRDASAEAFDDIIAVRSGTAQSDASGSILENVNKHYDDLDGVVRALNPSPYAMGTSESDESAFTQRVAESNNQILQDAARARSLESLPIDSPLRQNALAKLEQDRSSESRNELLELLNKQNAANGERLSLAGDPHSTAESPRLSRRPVGLS